jgi:limonene-1,2-epoxide hydrolase
MSEDNLQTVRLFCDAFARLDIDEILSFFTDDAVYHNMPMPPVKGKAAIRSVLDLFVKPSQAITFDMLNVAANGPIVFTERVDKFEMGGKRVELPVCGVFEVRDGKIAAWRDYFDMATWTRQTSGG